jgi:hypothetical protein
LLLRVSSLSKDVLRIGIVVANKEFAHLVVAPEKIMLGADVGQSMRDVWAILNDDPKKPGDMGYMRNDLPDDMGTYTGTIQAVYKKGVVSVEFPQGLKRDYAGTHFEIDKSLISFLFEDGSSTVDFGESKYVFGLKRPVTVVTGGSRCKETTTGRPDCTPDQVSVKLSCEDGKKLDTEAPYSRVAPFVSAQFSLKKPVKLNYIEDASNFCD